MVTLNAQQAYTIKPQKVVNTSHYPNGAPAPYTLKLVLSIIANNFTLVELDQTYAFAAGEERSEANGNPFAFEIIAPSQFSSITLLAKLVDPASGAILATGSMNASINQPLQADVSLGLSAPPSIVEATQGAMSVQIANQSLKNGLPAPLSITINVYGATGEFPFINEDHSVNLAAGETKTLPVSFSAPPLAWGSTAAITVQARDSAGAVIKQTAVSMGIQAAVLPPVPPPAPVPPLIVDLGSSGYTNDQPAKIGVFTVGGLPVVNAGMINPFPNNGYSGALPGGYLASPIVVSGGQLSGVSLVYQNLIPMLSADWFGVGSQPIEIWWMLTFEPEFVNLYHVEYGDFGEEIMVPGGTSYGNGYRAIISITASSHAPLVTTQQAYGGTYAVDIVEKYFGGNTVVGTYSGIFRLAWVLPGGAGFVFDRYWRIRNMMQVS